MINDLRPEIRIAVNASGDLIAQLASFQEEEAVIDAESNTDGISRRQNAEELFSALSLGLRDYCASAISNRRCSA